MYYLQANAGVYGSANDSYYCEYSTKKPTNVGRQPPERMLVLTTSRFSKGHFIVITSYPFC